MLQDLSYSSRQDNLTFVPTRRDEEIILHVHRLLGRLSSQLRTWAPPEELCSREPQLHVREVHTKTHARACTEWMEGLFGCKTDSFIQPA